MREIQILAYKTSQLSDLQQKNAELETENTNLKNDLAEIENFSQSSENLRKNAEETFMLYDKQNKELQEEIMKKDFDVQKLTNTIQSLQNLQTTLTTPNNEAALRKQIEELNADLNKYKSNNLDRLINENKELLEYKAKYEELEQQTKDLLSSETISLPPNKDLEKTILELQELLKEKDLEIDKQIAQNKENEELIIELSTEIDNLETPQLSSVDNEKVKLLETENENLKAFISQNNQISENTNFINTLQNQLRVARETQSTKSITTTK
jgi:chromosome segregation ATPase